MESEMAHLPKVSFSYVAGDSDFDVTERYAFWDSPNTISWFKSCGYTLYHRPEPDSPETCPALPFEPYTDIQYPYAKYDAESASQEERLRAIDRTGKVAFAQDSLGRHVVMKLVRAETDELRILRFLSKQSHDTLRENCVIPVLDLLPIEGFWFVVMPRWGCIVHLPQPGQLHEVITMMHSILKGLVFLHANGIAHHDIMLRNVLVDHFTDMWQLFNGNSTRGELRSNGRLLYALFDFDHSVLLPPGVKKGELRLPYWRSWGNFNRTNDTTTGEFDYDPFILDVGMLGVEFCDFFQHLTPIFPRLAPLLDMMTTRDLERRFTAAQALQFLEDSMTELTHSQSMAYISILETNAFYFEYDRWRDLRPEFVEKWKHYKEPPVPWTTLALRRLCWRPYFIHTVPWTRWFFSRLFSAPRTLLSWLWPSRKICI